MAEDATIEEGPRKVGAVQGLVVLIALIPLIGAYIYLGALLNLATFLFAGFLFSLYWGGIKAMAPAEFWPALLGSLGGLGTAFLLHALPPVMGTAGLAIALGVIALSIYLLVRNMLTILVNNAFMLLLTIGTCIAFKEDRDYAAAAASILLAGAYMGGLLVIVGKVIAMRARKPASPAVPTA